MYNATFLLLLAFSTACQSSPTTTSVVQGEGLQLLPVQSTTELSTEKIAPLKRVKVEGMSPATRVENIWLGGQPSEAALAELKRQGLGAIIDLRSADEKRGYDEVKRARELGLRYVALPVANAAALTDTVFDQGREILEQYRVEPKSSNDGLHPKSVLLHCASSNRVGALWLARRVLDEGVAWNVALAEARAVGLRTPALVEAAQEYVLGAGLRALGRYKLQIRARFPKVAAIDVTTLAAQMKTNKNGLLLDVRGAQEFTVSHLHGAQHAADLTQALKVLEGRPKSTEIVVYCSIGYRSASLAKQLQAAGYTGVKNLEGSIFEWANTGHEVFRAQAPVQKVHPYDTEWGKLLNKSLWSKLR